MGIELDMRNELEKPAPGKLVNVNGCNMHVFSDGQGDKTFVFMSGCGTACPFLDFKPLWSLLSADHRIAVVDKAGYGWSEHTNKSRDINTLVSDNREALKLAGIEPPYFLVPHSLSGFEAIYWAQNHPEEIKAIIGLDPRVPTYEKLPPRLFMKLLKITGVFSSDMINEINHLKENAEIINRLPLPRATPIYFFIAERNRKDWKETLIGYLSNFEISKYTLLPCNHYVYRHEFNRIADEIIAFVNGVS